MNVKKSTNQYSEVFCLANIASNPATHHFAALFAEQRNQKVACIFDSSKQKTGAETVAMTASAPVFQYFGLFLPQKAEETSFALVDKRGFFSGAGYGG